MALLTKFNIVRVLESNFINCSQLRHYTRWSHRRPKRVLTPEEYAKVESKYQAQHSDDTTVSRSERRATLNEAQENYKLKNKSLWVPKNVRSEETNQPTTNISVLDEKSEISHKTEAHSKKKKKDVTYKTMKDVQTASRDMLETVIDCDGNFVYTKLPDKDAALSKVLVTVKSHKEQVKKELALLEGKRLIKEALQANCKLESLLFSRKNDVEDLKAFLPKSGAKLYKIPYREIQMWSDLSTTPGIMGIFKIPDVEKFTPTKGSLDLIVICDNVREPGNLGAILRIAAGVGVQSVFLTKGCVDLWDTKVLRSACGAHFHLQIHRKMNWTDIKSRLQDLKGSVLIADNKMATDETNESSAVHLEDAISSLPLLPYYGVNFGELGTLVLIVGGETEGISGDSYRFAADASGLRINIPLSNNVDSLNTGTALGIILFEIKRQLNISKCEEKLKIKSC